MACTICWQEPPSSRKSSQLVDRWDRFDTAEQAKDKLVSLHKQGINLEDVLLFEHQAESDPEYFLNSFGIYLEDED